MNKDHDLIILGSGSTAFAAALHAQTYGARVLMIEKSVLGGTCINWGCIPSKTMIHAALFRHETALGAMIGLEQDCRDIDFNRLSTHRDLVVSTLRKERYLDVLQKVPNLTLIKGTGRFVDQETIEVDDIQYSANSILIAAGGIPRIPSIPGLEASGFLTSRSALLMKTVPESLVIIGGGVVAVELGQMFHRLGCKVTILEHGPRLLQNIDRDVSESVQGVLTAEGVEIVPNAAFCSIARIGNLRTVAAEIEGTRHEYTAEQLLVAVGTTPATAEIGIEKAGVELDRKGFVITDERMRTSVNGIWAAGDVVGRTMTASVGAREGIVAIDNMFNPTCGCAMDYLGSPMAIFTDPEIGIVGHTEESARQAGHDPITNMIPVNAIPKAHVTGHTAGIIKLVADRASHRLLGAHLLCHRGAEMINEAALAISLKATIMDIAGTLHVYPSIGEGLRLCAQGFDRDITRLSCCAE